MTTPRQELEEIVIEIHRTSSVCRGPVEITPLIRLLRLCERLVAENERAMKVCRKVMEWWVENQYATTSGGEDGEYNVYDEEPSFVVSARAALTAPPGPDGKEEGK